MYLLICGEVFDDHFGVGKFVKGLAESLVQRNRKVVVLGTHCVNRKEIIRSVMFIGLARRFNFKFHFSVELLRPSILKFVKNSEIVHINSPFLAIGIFAIIIRCVFLKKSLVSCHGSFRKTQFLKPGLIKVVIKNFLKFLVHRRLVWFHVSSIVERNDLRELMGIDEKSIFYAQTGIEFDDEIGRRPFRKRYPKRVFFFSRLISSKGVDFSLEAWQIIGKDQWILTIAGKGPLESEINKFCNVEENRAVFNGFLTEESKLAMIDSSDVVVFPSLSEGQSVAVGEVISRGVPVLISTECGMDLFSKVFPDLVFSAGDLSEFVRKLEHLMLLGFEGRRDLAARIFEFSSMHYPWKIRVNDFFSIYEVLEK